MNGRCGQESCPNWDGDGGSCPCATFDTDTVKCCLCGDRTPNVDQGLCGSCVEQSPAKPSRVRAS